MTNTPDLRALVERLTLVERMTVFGDIHPHLNDHARALVDEAIAALTTLQHRVAEMEAALESAGQVIDYTAATFWTGRPGTIAIRPAQVDKALRSFRKARSTLKDRGEGR